MTDVRELLREAVEGFEPRGDRGSVEGRVERRRRRRQVAAGVVALGVFAAGGVLAWAALRPGASTTAAPESSTYVLSGFQVRPHVDPASGEVDPMRADVSFAARWSTDTYPGVHRCEVRILDPAGFDVGSLSFELSPPSRSGSHEFAVPIGGSIEGTTAEGSCDPDRLDAPVAVVISGERVVRTVDGPMVVYDAAPPEGTLDGARPGAQACTATVWGDDGRLLGTASFYSADPSGGVQDVDLDERSSLAEVAQATVTCRPYVREDAFPDPKPPGPASTRSVTILVPDVVGLPPSEARASLAALGLGVSVTAAHSDEVATGLVAAQQPLPGVEVSTRTHITIEISQGPAPIE